MTSECPSYYSILTANVRYDKRLSGDQKVLYSEITALTNKYGYCSASNAYFANLYSKEPVTISRWMSMLKKCGYIDIKISQEDGNKRKIYLVDKSVDKSAKSVDKSVDNSGGVLTQMIRPIDANDKTPIDANDKTNNTSINIKSNKPPTSPPGDGCCYENFQEEFTKIKKIYPLRQNDSSMATAMKEYAAIRSKKASYEEIVHGVVGYSNYWEKRHREEGSASDKYIYKLANFIKQKKFLKEWHYESNGGNHQNDKPSYHRSFIDQPVTKDMSNAEYITFVKKTYGEEIKKRILPLFSPKEHVQ